MSAFRIRRGSVTISEVRLATYRVLLLAGGLGLIAFPAGLLVADAWEPGLTLVLVLPVAFAAAGAVAMQRAPGNRAGEQLAAVGAWHLVAFGITGAAVVLAGSGGAAWPLVLAARVCFALGFVAYAALFAVFPDGRYERTYERWTVRAVVLLGVALPALGFLSVGPKDLPVELADPVTAVPPLQLVALAPLDAATQAVPLAALAGLVLFAMRYRRSDAARREQMRWPLVSVVLGAGALVTYNGLGLLGDGTGDAVFLAAFATLPVALVVGMVRHRLFDVDLVLRRSLVYAVLWLGIGGIYVAVAAALGVLAGRRFPVEVAVAITIGATLVFTPARRRLERLADRLVFGERLTRYELVRRVGENLEAQLDLRGLGPRLAEVVERGLDAQWVRVWLPPAAAEPDPGPVALAVPITHEGERLGEIRCGRRRDGGYSDADRELLVTLARQAALAARSTRLAADLQARVDELAASRSRIAAAADAERRRIERDLHDGIQQDLVALLAKAELARTALARDPSSVDRLLGELQHIARQTHAELRDLVRGILPAVLGDRGLIDAVEARVAQLPLGVRIDADPRLRGARYPAPIELAAYFVVCEGLTNSVRHSGSSEAVVELGAANGTLRVVVRDRGAGFDPAAATGTGLPGLRDRLEVLGGLLHVESAPGLGTRLFASLPVSPLPSLPAKVQGSG